MSHYRIVGLSSRRTIDTHPMDVVYKFGQYELVCISKVYIYTDISFTISQPSGIFIFSSDPELCSNERFHNKR